jgi:hypothetical protein
MLRWNTLRGVGNSRLVKLSSTFPFIGYAILFNQYVSEALKLSESLVPDLIATTTTRLYFVYFGLMFLGLGSIGYQIFCPWINKKYEDSAEYAEAEHAITSNTLNDLIREVLDEAGKRHLGLYHATVSDNLREYYEHLSTSSPVARTLVTLLFGLGITLLAVPSAQSFVSITRRMLTSL